MTAEYEFKIAGGAFPNDSVSPAELVRQIEDDDNLPNPLGHYSVHYGTWPKGNKIRLDFESPLTAQEEIDLNAKIASHDGAKTPEGERHRKQLWTFRSAPGAVSVETFAEVAGGWVRVPHPGTYLVRWYVELFNPDLVNRIETRAILRQRQAETVLGLKLSGVTVAGEWADCHQGFDELELDAGRYRIGVEMRRVGVIGEVRFRRPRIGIERRP